MFTQQAGFFFGGEGVGALRESSPRGCEGQIT